MNKSIKSVLILGSGALKIGEAGEFDYSGAQCIKALKEEGIRTILINPNIATVQTSTDIADEIYLLPITPYFVEKVIQKENPDGIMVAFGGQTALNCAITLYRTAILEKYNVQVLGTPIQTIIDTEDRDIFIEKLNEIGVKTARSIACESIEEAVIAANTIGYPLIVRAAFALGGLGSGFANNETELRHLISKSFSYSKQILVEESLKGWKEIEYEVVRDKNNNCITVCNMENFDPIGVHTGESIVIAPSQTLTNEEYHLLRTIAIKTIQHLGVIGECNIQYALNPKSLEYRVIEVNARLSRSSALASKATAYPLAFVAAKLALGYNLYELKNSVTHTTTAFFEPALDYVVVKIPRWDLTKFQGVSRQIGSAMKSVGEVMAIGRNFEEALQKGIRMLDTGQEGFISTFEKTDTISTEALEEILQNPTDLRLFFIAQAFAKNYSIDQIFKLTQIDSWFLQRLKHIFDQGKILHTQSQYSENNYHLPESNLLLNLKKIGFSDKQIAEIHFKGDKSYRKELEIRSYRKKLGIIPYVKQIDTLAAEFPAYTNYLYLTYSGAEHDITPEKEPLIAILGSGTYRIGSSVEFDWCGVNAAQTIQKNAYKTLIINYNPETVSTDYDMSDRLYFEELSFERVMDILEYESPKGVVLAMGGQIPNNLATKLYDQQFPILGTSPLDIDNAENRHKFSTLLDELGINQPKWQELSSFSAIQSFIKTVGFPVLIRPSYVLSGAAMNVVYNDTELENYLALAQSINEDHPVVVSEFIQGAAELELDAVAATGKIITHAISEHVEAAGVHSGDATMYFPSQNIDQNLKKEILHIGQKIAQKFNISGPFNIQFLAKEGHLKVIELNLRASRSFPFISKVSGINFIEKATDVLLKNETKTIENEAVLNYVGVKASQFSYTRLAGADPILSVDMSATGEVGCIGKDAEEAFLKALLSVGYKIPMKGILLIFEDTVPFKKLEDSLKSMDKSIPLYLLSNNTDVIDYPYFIKTVDEQEALKMLQENTIDLLLNIPVPTSQITYKFRRAAVDYNINLITDIHLAKAFIGAFSKYSLDDLEIKSLNAYYSGK